MVDHVHALPEGYRLREYAVSGTLGFGGFGIAYSAQSRDYLGFRVVRKMPESVLGE